MTTAATSSTAPALDRRWLSQAMTAYVHAARFGFNCAHTGANIIAAWLLVRDHRPSAEAVAAIDAQLQLFSGRHAWQFVELPPSPPEPRAEERIIAALAPTLGRLKVIGHSVIFPVLAVVAIRELGRPATVAETEACIKITQMMDLPPAQVDKLFDIDVTALREVERPPYADNREMARDALRVIAQCQRFYSGLFQGWIGHVATHAHALLTLERLGYPELARRCHASHRLQVAQLGVLLDYHNPTLTPAKHIDVTPLDPAFYRHELVTADPSYSHTFKYTDAILDLLALIDDPALDAQVREKMGWLLP
jgi:hypothetical protein